jgi:hypothetical protein
VEHRRGADFVDEIEQPDRLLALDSLRETNLGERAANERAQSEETAMEHVSRDSVTAPAIASSQPGSCSKQHIVKMYTFGQTRTRKSATIIQISKTPAA